MNDTQLEAVLRKAPAKPAPAGLLDKLEADIALPRPETARADWRDAVPWWRRWSLAWACVVLAAITTLAVQQRTITRLREDIASLRIGAAGLEQLVLENKQLAALRVQHRELESLRRDHLDLQRLRQEVAQLRAQAQELAALQAENQRLLAEKRQVARAAIGTASEPDLFAQANARDQTIKCATNLKQIGLAAVVWSRSNQRDNVFPPDFLSMKKELGSGKYLVCPSDTARSLETMADWAAVTSAAITYEMISPDLKRTNASNIIFARCPIHGTLVLYDGSVQQMGDKARGKLAPGATIDSLHQNKP
ncbi:MAG: hypothetical protein EXS27_06150 [Pedosphaera sp.]|nr:hypothetical protein [Pedosphaera sp.]